MHPKKHHTFPFRLTFLLFLVGITSALLAQDEIVQLTTDDFNTEQTIELSNLPNWRFQRGNDPAWAQSNFDDQSWEQKTPRSLRLNMIDGEGRLEGWFRLRFRVDKTLANGKLLLQINNFGQALEIFLDGEQIGTLGQMETSEQPFQRSKRDGLRTYFPISLQADQEHVLAIHYLHKKPKFPESLFSNHESLYFAARINSTEAVSKIVARDQFNARLNLVIVSICLTITFLFVIIFIRNRKEKLPQLLLLGVTLSGLIAITAYLEDNKDIVLTFGQYTTVSSLNILGIAAQLFLMVFVLAQIFFKRKPKQIGLLIALAIFNFIEMLLIRQEVFGLPIFLTYLVIYVYYIAKAWKSLRGAQWALVAGIFSAVTSIVVFFIFSIFSQDQNPLESFLVRGLFAIVLLSFPVSLMVYIALRFNEIIGEVRTNAQRLVEVTEEKRQQALNQKAELEKQVEARTAELQESLETLKNTQEQLIQQEKLAGLGQLTAGIAHEIKNPLNFVNNFSEVSQELLQELQEAIDQQDWPEVKEISENIQQNLAKIHQHGSRADSIVRSMLQHSRGGSGIPEPTDLNELLREYVNLAFHGMRAGKNPINVKIDYDLDESIDTVDLIQEDFSRVILNLANNAFDALTESANAMSDLPQLTIRTSKMTVSKKGQEEQKILITISDNGPGIPRDIQDKILQPFFTTKKGKDGTGLGLSISNDIVKAHGGTLSVQSQLREGTTFTIQLPIKSETQ